MSRIGTHVNDTGAAIQLWTSFGRTKVSLERTAGKPYRILQNRPNRDLSLFSQGGSKPGALTSLFNLTIHPKSAPFGASFTGETDPIDKYSEIVIGKGRKEGGITASLNRLFIPI